MGRKKEPMIFSGALEVQAQKPLDARTKVDLYDDLTEASSFPYAYEGMTVYVVENKKSYTLIGSDTTVLANWKEVGSGGGSGSTDWNDITNKPSFATVAISGSYNDLGDKPTIPSAYDDTAITGRVSAVETALGGHTVGANVPSDAVFTDTVYDDTTLAARVTAVESGKANATDVYTKTQTDAAIATAMTDVDVEHFHVVTALPAVADAVENHEYVLVTYEQDGTTIATEEHYLFYDGAFHQRTTTVSLEGYATETYVNNRVQTPVPTGALFTDTVYDDTALAARVTANEDAMTDLLTRDYATTGAYDDIWQNADETIYPNSAAWNYRQFVSTAKYGGRNFADYVYVISYNDGADDTFIWSLEEAQWSPYGTLNPSKTYAAYDKSGALVCYFYTGIHSSAGMGYYLCASDRSAGENGASRTLGDRIASIKAYDPKTIYNVSRYVSEDFNLAEAATHADVASGVAEAKAYADGKALVTQTGWGVVTTGSVTVRGITTTSAGSVTLDLSEWGFADVDDYDIFVTVTQNYSAISARAWVEKQSAASARIIAITGQGDAVGVYYVIVAKGYGAVAYTGEIPTGGATGQILTKRSDADGDYGWKNALPTFEMSRNDSGGNVVQTGTVVIDGTTYGTYEFYYKTGALPTADATKEYRFDTLLADYTVFMFMGAEGITGNGVIISNGRTDNNNRLIIQQFSKNNKTITIRAYQDFSAQVAYLKVKFIGTKTA